MKLSKIYSDRPEFKPVDFNDGLSVVVAEIRLPENRDRDTHNLGKTTLGRMLDFCFLSGRDAGFFLFKHFELFRGFTFFLEVELPDGTFVTVRRGVEHASRIAFKRHTSPGHDLSALPDEGWDHADVPFDRAKELLDGLLDWRALKPYPFRSGLGYLLRTQDDYRDVFQLTKSAASKHVKWKPFLAHILGFDADLVSRHYGKESELEEKEEQEKTLKGELAGSVEDISKIEGILLLKRQETDKRQRLLDEFDFRTQDKEKTKQVVDVVEARIAALNGERYSLQHNRRKVVSALDEDRILFDPDDAQRLFDEAGVLFAGQIKRDFVQLIAFNKAITEERRTYLKEELTEIDAELKRIGIELNKLGKQRSETLSYLTGTDPFGRYKKLSDEMVTLKADIKALERQRESLHRLQELRAEIRRIAEERNHLQTQVEDDVERQNSDVDSLFSTIRLFFSEIVEEVIDRKALLSVSPNQYGHLEFRAEILDDSGNATSADMGHTYRKLLCVAFDLAILRAHLPHRFPRFVFHDGVLESLDDRKKENMLGVIRRYAGYGIQPVITLIDSDLPARGDGEPSVFDESEIILRLHDEDETGRLFRMRTW